MFDSLDKLEELLAAWKRQLSRTYRHSFQFVGRIAVDDARINGYFEDCRNPAIVLLYRVGEAILRNCRAHSLQSALVTRRISRSELGQLLSRATKI